jgi:hypothetical protein
MRRIIGVLRPSVNRAEESVIVFANWEPQTFEEV